MAANEVAVGGAVVAGVIALLLALRPYVLNKRETADPQPLFPEDAAGAQNTEFWEKRFDRLDTAVATLDRISREHRGLTQREIQDIRDLLIDLDVNMKVAIAVRPERRTQERD
jgi:hypothetical protein